MRQLTAILVLALFSLAGCDTPGIVSNENNNNNNEAPVACGNSIVELGEECDEGIDNSDFTPNMCRTDCRDPHCGDAVADTGEVCDDGDDGNNQADDCPNDCEAPVCGDGHLWLGHEQCDDGNTINGDSCRDDCGQDFTLCGNGLVNPGEDCDGASLDGASCDSLGLGTGSLACTGACIYLTSGCIPPGCGNGIVEQARGEECDGVNLGGQTCASQGYSAGVLSCDASCLFEEGACISLCGNGVVEPNEGCDDWNGDNDDGCTDLCVIEDGYYCQNHPSVCHAQCGDGIVAAGVEAEQCDDGSGVGGDGCSAICEQEVGWACTGSPSSCVLDPQCGNGLAEGYDGEDCDLTDLDGQTCASRGYTSGALDCDGFCVFNEGACVSVCGNGLIETGEACDDGNVVDTDGCTALCTVAAGYGCQNQPSECHATCGDNVVAAGIEAEECDDGSLLAGDGCDASCVRETGWICPGNPSACVECAPGLVACDASCIDPTLNPDYCGASGDCRSGNVGDICDGVDESCQLGVCLACSLPLEVCSFQCIDTDTDPAHCGLCDDPCTQYLNSSSGCSGGGCDPIVCSAGFEDCNAVENDGCEVPTTDFATSNTHCGGCGNACNVAAGQECCGGTCRNTMTDSNNCSTCGNVCALGSACCGGSCATTAANCQNCGTTCGGGGCVVYGGTYQCAKLVFTTAETFTGVLGGYSGAAATCTSLANNAGFAGSYQAWISSDLNWPAKNMVGLQSHNGLIVNPNGQTIANNWADLTDGTIDRFMDVTQNGTTVSWHGTFSNTNISGTARSANDCANWTTTSGTQFMGYTSMSDCGWTGCVNSYRDCDGGSPTHLYCFEQ